MFRAILGLIKGLLVGGGVGYGLIQLGSDSTALTYLGCAVVGALVGIVCGRAPWRAGTIWTPVMKALVGGLLGVGLCFVGLRFLPDINLFKVQSFELTSRSGPILAGAIGVLYGMFVEIDDGGKTESDEKKPPAGRARA
jgi:hypothetical protein